VQYALLAVALIASVAYMFRKLAPALSIRCQASVAATLSGPQRPLLMQRLGRSIKPREASGDCGSGCGTCGSCGRGGAAVDSATEQPVKFISTANKKNATTVL
jgi:hypothetical protein